jgi:hypothetical protein
MKSIAIESKMKVNKMLLIVFDFELLFPARGAGLFGKFSATFVSPYLPILS